MKKLFYAFAALAVVASCAKVAEVETALEPKEENNLVHMTIRTQAPETKTYIEKTGEKSYQPQWNEGDQLAVFFDAVKATKDAVLDNKGNDGDPAEFMGDVTVGNGDHTVYAFYPATTVFKKGSTDTKVELQVATVQRPAANSFDPSADIAVARAYDINVTSATVDIDDMVFARLLSTVKITVTQSNDDIDAGEKINAITITGEANLTGAIEWDFDTVQATAASDDPSVTADLSAAPIDFGASTYVLVNPATLAVGSALTVTVSTDAHEVTKTIPNLPQNIEFPLGGIAELRINLDNSASVDVAAPIAEPAGTGWYLVKKAHWLRPGDEVAIVAAGHDAALAVTQQTKYRESTDVTISAGKLTITDNVQRFTLETGTVSNTFAFKSVNGAQADKYIYAASSSDNLLKSQATKDDNASFYVSIDEDGEAFAQSMGEYERDVLRYNSTNPRFCCYASTSSVQENLRIFKHYSSAVPALDTPANLEAIGVDGDVYITWDAVAGADSYTVTCGALSQTGVTENEYTFSDVEPGTYTVTVKAISNDHTTLLDSDPASTSVTVEDTNAHYYVKVTKTADITDGDYLIVYTSGNLAFNGSLETLDATGNTINVTISNGKILANDTTNAAKFTIDVTAGTIKSASNHYIGVGSNSNGLKQSDDAETYTHTFEIDASGDAVIKADFTGSTMTLRYNSASNQNRFRYYKSGQQAVQLYKYE